MSAVAAIHKTFEVAQGEAGTRLDRWLAACMPELSRARLKELITSGHVVRDQATISDASYRVKPGERVSIAVPPVEPLHVEGESIPLSVVYEDDQLIVIDKPAGLVVHPAAGHATGTLVNALIAHCGESLSGIGGVKRPGIVHRLDKDTSGLLVVAKTDLAHQSLADQFKSHGLDGRLKRLYRALVWGKPDRVAGTIDAALSRSSANRTKIAVTRAEAGRHAVTHFRILETFPGTAKADAVSLLELELETGRTHQIRVHLAHIGHPVLGDAVYGGGFRTSSAVLSEGAQAALAALGRQALHASMLGFEHPKSHRRLEFESNFPLDIQFVIDALRGARKSRQQVAPRARRSSKKAERN